MGHLITDALANTGTRILGLAEKLAADIPESRFARFAEGKTGPVIANHPAFVFGHLALYPARMAELMGLQIDVAAPPAWHEVLAAGKDCLDDPAGTIYPGKAEIMQRYADAHTRLIKALPTVGEARLAAPGPHERAPTVLAAVDFVLGSHQMLHLGQVSTWRRIEGLKPVM